MNPLIAVQAVMAAVYAAPKVMELAAAAKEFIQQMFAAGLITKEAQDATFKYVEAVTGAAKAGVIPPSFQVQPDPETTT
jgi:hypothetical protein